MPKRSNHLSLEEYDKRKLGALRRARKDRTASTNFGMERQHGKAKVVQWEAWRCPVGETRRGGVKQTTDRPSQTGRGQLIPATGKALAAVAFRDRKGASDRPFSFFLRLPNRLKEISTYERCRLAKLKAGHGPRGSGYFKPLTA